MLSVASRDHKKAKKRLTPYANIPSSPQNRKGGKNIKKKTKKRTVCKQHQVPQGFSEGFTVCLHINLILCFSFILCSTLRTNLVGALFFKVTKKHDSAFLSP